MSGKVERVDLWYGSEVVEADEGYYAVMEWEEYERLCAEIKELKYKLGKAWLTGWQEALGLVECPECLGGERLGGLPEDCPRCQGHRWIREESGDDL